MWLVHAAFEAIGVIATLAVIGGFIGWYVGWLDDAPATEPEPDWSQLGE